MHRKIQTHININIRIALLFFHSQKYVLLLIMIKTYKLATMMSVRLIFINVLSFDIYSIIILQVMEPYLCKTHVSSLNLSLPLESVYNRLKNCIVSNNISFDDIRNDRLNQGYKASRNCR